MGGYGMDNIGEFIKRLEYNDFAEGDSFYLEGIKFEVIENKREGIK
jgi:hypothetical protein